MLDVTRQSLIKRIAELRGNSRVITYLTSERVPLNTQISEDVIPVLQRHVLNGKSKEKISLFLYTRGGNMIAPLKIVNLFRSYFKSFEILVPHFAHSAGTLITLGADAIVMTKLAELSPVDPTTMHPFNPPSIPPNPSMPILPRPINVEDVNSYFLFAKEKVGVRPEDMDKIYSYLIDNTHKENTIHPLSLGNVYRGYRMAKMLAERLLYLHTVGWFERIKVNKIVDALTGRIPTHDYPIYRDEAKKLGLKVEYASDSLEVEMLNLLKNYTEIMDIGKPFNPVEILGGEQQKDFEYKGAFIESDGLCDEFTYKGRIIQESEAPPKVGMNILSAKWGTSR